MSQKQLVSEVAEFIGRIDKLRTVFPDQQQELFALWKRVSNETIYCTSCGKVTADTYAKLKKWYAVGYNDLIAEPEIIEEPKKKSEQRNTSKKNK